MISALIVCVLVIGSPPKGNEKPAKTGEKDAEIARLREEITRLSRDRSKLKKSLKAAKQTIAELREENEKLRVAADPEALTFLGNQASQMLLEVFQEFDRVIAEIGVPKDDGDAILSAALMAINRWRGDDENKATMSGPTVHWLGTKFTALQDRAQDQARRVTEEFRTSAEALKRAFDGVDRVGAAKVIGSVEGLRVEWQGTLIKLHQRNPFMGHDLEVSCGGVMARVTLRNSDISQSYRVGQDVTVRGRITGVDYYPFMTIEVELTDGVVSRR